MRHLVAAGADLDAVDHFGQSPLHRAVRRGAVEIAAFLRQSGADTSLSDADGLTPNELACALGHSDMLDTLTRRLNMTSAAEQNWNDVFGAIKSGDLPALTRLLEEHPQLVNARDESGSSALLISIYHGKPTLTALLLRAGAQVNAFEASAAGLGEELERALRDDPELVRQRSHDGWTLLHLAAFFGHRQLVARLLDEGSDPLAISQNQEANLAINAAAAAARNDVVALLLERGCPADARGTSTAFTALHLAAHDGNTALVELLLEAGADRRLTNESGESALDLAREGGHREVAHLLEAT